MEEGAGRGLVLLAGGRCGGATVPPPRHGSAAATSRLRRELEERLSRGLDRLLQGFGESPVDAVAQRRTPALGDARPP